MGTTGAEMQMLTTDLGHREEVGQIEKEALIYTYM